MNNDGLPLMAQHVQLVEGGSFADAFDLFAATFESGLVPVAVACDHLYGGADKGPMAGFLCAQHPEELLCLSCLEFHGLTHEGAPVCAITDCYRPEVGPATAEILVASGLVSDVASAPPRLFQAMVMAHATLCRHHGGNRRFDMDGLMDVLGDAGVLPKADGT
jgi:hypothetical protein